MHTHSSSASSLSPESDQRDELRSSWMLRPSLPRPHWAEPRPACPSLTRLPATTPKSSHHQHGRGEAIFHPHAASREPGGRVGDRGNTGFIHILLMKLERLICVEVNSTTVHGPRRAAQALTGSTLSRFMVSKGGRRVASDLNHAWNYEELITREAEEQSKGPCGFQRCCIKTLSVPHMVTGSSVYQV